ncbi:MAG TPA: serine/threonine-protein kinase [Thermoanaerobaculia bacterium]|nr:serine/threonine-protein kinase [Thermoanaerobaculia bacterium]
MLHDLSGGGGGHLTSLSSGEWVANRFRVLRLLGEGAVGEVWEADDAELGRRVALKALRPEMAGAPAVRERFKREVGLAHQITHPNVCRLYDLFFHQPPNRRRAGDAPLAVVSMELLAGETLAERLERRGPLPIEQALEIARQVAAALAAGHRAGVVHRDLKSSNVVLVEGPDGLRAVVTDFGLARSLTAEEDPQLTASGDLLGSPAYMAPEQIEGRPLGPAADLYALGVVLFEMVTGALPFTGATAVAAAFRRLEGPPPSPRLLRPDLDPRWQAVILRCLEREPEGRFGSAAEVAAALGGAPSPDAKPAAPRGRRRAWRRWPFWSAAVALFTLSSASWIAAPRSASPAGDLLGPTRALQTRAARLAETGERPRAEALLAEALATYRALGDRHGEASAQSDLAQSLAERGELPAARELLEGTLLLAREIEALPVLVTAERRLGSVLRRQGDFPAAQAHFEAALLLARRTGRRDDELRTLSSLAFLRKVGGDLAGAEQYLRAAATGFAESGDRSAAAGVMSNLGIVLAAQGELAEAGEQHERALALYRELGARDKEAEELHRQGEVHRYQGRGELAWREHLRALALRRELEDWGGVARSELASAKLLLDRGRPEEAREWAQRAAEAFEAAAARDFAAEARAVEALAAFRTGRRDEARGMLARWRPHLEASQDPTVVLYGALVAAELAAGEEAAEVLRQALARSRGAGLPLELEARLALARARGAGDGREATRSELAALAAEAERHGVLLVTRLARAEVRSLG